MNSWTNERLIGVLAMYRSGLKKSHIAKAIGVSPTWVSHLIARALRAERKNEITPIDADSTAIPISADHKYMMFALSGIALESKDQ